jgi:very-short-patch-repair endonuclease
MMPRRIHRPSDATPYVRCLVIAARQYGLIERTQALASGMSARMIDRRLDKGEWRLFLPGVYAVRSSTPCWLRSAMGAALWAGPEAAASGRTGGVLWGFDGLVEGAIEVSTTGRVRGDHFIVHHVDDLGWITRRKGIPVTDQYRTILDLAGLVDLSTLEAAVDSGLRMKLLHLPLLRAAVANSAGKRGIRNLRLLVEERGRALGLTRSKLEALVSNFLRRHGISGGVRNYNLVIDGTFIACLDVAWPDHRVGIEVDSRRWHMGHAFWERDAARYARLASHDWRILPVTSGQLKRREAEFAEQILRLLAPSGT